MLKIRNSRLRFLYRKNRFLNVTLHRLLCNTIIQTFFDNACNAWYLNINKKLNTRLQNKYIRFCSRLNDRSSIKSKDFEKINWLLIHETVSQCSLYSVHKFFYKNFPNYFDKIYVPIEINGVYTRSSYEKLSFPHWKRNTWQRYLS